ncbi:A24 family peptidase [Litchfieldia salsa]|uniref:Prepilin peptidase CpaA n=1 Tax=Litchfieldia salsa TaxID=930152 RepID=A0A1H0UCD5_9BACI|nr:A24 family peptidase [Litchfieldia salsa]SDP63803.1 prepilin peptidase CpaA [Litchfieldia salsa]
MFIYPILFIALFISFITDIKERKILNIITLPTILYGVIYHSIANGWSGFLFSGFGFVVGFGLLLIPFILGGMGAGDVKLMSAIGSLMGAMFIMKAFVYISIIGGVISLFLIIRNRGYLDTVKNVGIMVPSLKDSQGNITLNEKSKDKIVFPYGVPIVLGTVLTIIWGGV